MENESIVRKKVPCAGQIGKREKRGSISGEVSLLRGRAGVNTNTHNTRVLVYQGKILFSTFLALFLRRNPSIKFVEIFDKQIQTAVLK